MKDRKKFRYFVPVLPNYWQAAKYIRMDSENTYWYCDNYGVEHFDNYYYRTYLPSDLKQKRIREIEKAELVFLL